MAPAPVVSKELSTENAFSVAQKNPHAVPEIKRGQKGGTSTPGKKVHWLLTYIGGDWILNSAIGVGFAYLTARTELGKKYYVEPINKGLGAVLSPVIKDEKTLEKVIGGGRDFFSIMFGGTMVNPILTRLENHKNKKAISKSIDTMIYGKDRVENDPRFKQAYDEIDLEPKKDTKGVWIARGIAVAPLWAATFFPKGMKFIQSNEVPVLKWVNADTISNFTRTTAEKMGIRPKKMIEAVEKDPTTGKLTSNWQKLHDYIGFDYGLTIYYAILHSMAFSWVAKQRHNKRDAKQEAQQKAIPTTVSNNANNEVQLGVAEKPVAPQVAEIPTSQVNHIAERELMAAQQQAQLS